MISESAFIDWLAQHGADSQALQDDTFFDPVSRQFYTTDTLVEGQHFDSRYCSAFDIGWKAAAVNISDIAAMGGKPLFLLVSVAIPKHYDMDWLQELYQGLFSACERFQLRIVGGDTVGSSIFSITITVIGICLEGRQPAHRWLGEAEDLVISTGPHGLSAVGLKSLQAQDRNYPFSQKVHKRPSPQVEAALILSQLVPRVAMMDSSDGLADSALKLARACQKNIVLNQTKIIIHPEVQAYAAEHELNALDLALYGGEDFQLIACVSQHDWDKNHLSLENYFHPIGKVLSTNAIPQAFQKVDNSYNAYLLSTEDRWLPLIPEKTYQHF